MIALIALAVLTLVFVNLNVLDVITTNAFLAKGTGVEANPVSAWFQKVMGSYWWIEKTALLIVLALSWWVGPSPFTLTELAGLNLYYGYVVYQNAKLL